jgi:hypothetical protein
MTKGRMAAAIGVGFLLSEVLAVVVHGVLLDADYQPFRGSLLRGDASWQMVLLPAAHLLFVSVLVWIFGRAELRGSAPIQGVKLGLLGWMVGQAPLWLLWYAEQPWPGQLVIKQLVLEFASSVILGITIAAVARRREPARSVVSAV